MSILDESIFEPAVAAPDRIDGPVQWFVFRRRELLVTAAGALPTKEALDQHRLQPERSLYLGRLGELHCFAAQVPDGSTPPAGMTYRDLMSVFASIEPHLHQLAGRAVQLLEWDRTHQKCGACGERTEPSSADRSRICSGCGLA